MCSIVVSPLVSVMLEVEQLKQLGFSAAAIGLREAEKAAIEGKCEIVFGSPETWLSTSLRDGKLGRQTAAFPVDEGK